MYMNKISEETVLNDQKKLGLSVMIASFFVSFIILGITFFNDKLILGKSFLLGTIITLVYLRMQFIFANTMGKRDLLSIILYVFSTGRIVLFGAIIYLVAKRVDLFDVFFTILGIASVHLISFSAFIYDSFKPDQKKIELRY